jgi:lysophospholipase L1-like esterase
VGILQALRGGNWAESPERYAVGGIEIDTVAANIDAQLATRDTVPEYVLLLLGANDYEKTEADFKTSYRYVLSAIHTKWSSAKIYCCKSYRVDKEAEMDIVNNWIDSLVAEHPTYLFDGINTKDVLKGHGELLVDSVHPNHAGCMAIADYMAGSIE